MNSISPFSVYASYVNAKPRFVIYLDKDDDGVSDSILLSDYQFASNGEWKVTTGGNRWGWTESNMQLSVYGSVWEQLDFWKPDYGNATVPYVGIVLEYWAVDPDGFGEPLYADELIINAVTYNIAPVSTPAPSPANSVNITDPNSWPMFHKDLAHSGYSESTGPLTNQTLWKFQTGGKMRSSCAVVNGTVYVGSDDGYLYAFGSPSTQPAPSYNITVRDSSPKSSPNSEPASSSEPSLGPSSTLPATVIPAQITVPTNAATMTLLGIVLGIVVVATPIVVVISVCLLFYFKKRKQS